MIYVYDHSIVGCCNRRQAVRAIIKGMSADLYRLRHTRRFRGVIRPDAELVYTDEPDITTGYEAAGIPVRPIGPDRHS